MTYKEEAKELFNKYRLADLHIKDSSFITKLLAKRCALICMNEKMKTLKSIIGSQPYMWTPEENLKVVELKEIKKEIEKL